MIPRSSILAWQENIPWIEDKQIEQDLILSRILEPAINIEKIIECFKFYLNKEEKKISVSEFTANITAKLNDQKFVNDTKPLLARAGFPHKFPIRFYPKTQVYLDKIKKFHQILIRVI